MYGCHHVLTKLIHNYKQTLDKGLNADTIIIDLSKAFDSSPRVYTPWVTAYQT